MLSLLFIFLSHLFLNQAAILHCDFETYCNDFAYDSNWGLTDGQHPQPINHDHTLNASSGHYLYYNPPNNSKSLTAQIKTKDWLQPSIDRSLCFRMWYYTPRLSFPFNIQLVQGDDEQLTRIVDSIKGKDPSIDDWTLINITLPNEKIKIFIRLNLTIKGLAFDDISVDYCDGSRPLPPKVLYACDFESSCSEDFISLPFYPYQWKILKASDANKTENGAPSVDYTFGNASGHYALLPSLKIIEQGRVGYLHLQREFQITSEDSYCLNFQYYSYGRLLPSNLRVYLWNLDEFKTIQMLWPELRGGRYTYASDNWTWGIINLPIGHYSLLFRVDTQDNSQRSFALDNIAITSCDYPSYELNPYSTLLSFSCNFDNSTMCNMINGDVLSSPTYNFTVFTGDTLPNKDLGPTRDHTSNSTSGGFLYWDQHLPFTARDYGKVYPLKTVEQNSGMCVKFAYYVKSEAVNKNGTTVSVSVGGCYGATLWYPSLDDSQGWQTVIVPLLKYFPACPATLYFSVNQRELARVSVAFDDIAIDQCSALIPTTTTTIITTTIPTTTTTITTTSTSTITTSSSTIITSTITITSTPTITSTIASTSTPTTTSRSNAHRLLFLNGYSLIIIYFLSHIF